MDRWIDLNTNNWEFYQNVKHWEVDDGLCNAERSRARSFGTLINRKDFYIDKKKHRLFIIFYLGKDASMNT